MASFLDTLFGGGAEKEAADKNKALYSQYGTLGRAISIPASPTRRMRLTRPRLNSIRMPGRPKAH
jgi:hypothetical protein